jgi:hypothetical protein
MHDVPMEDVLNDTNVEPEAPPAASGGFDRRTLIRRGAALGAGMAATGRLVHLGRAQENSATPEAESGASDDATPSIVEAATTFLDRLSDDQKDAVLFDWEDTAQRQRGDRHDIGDRHHAQRRDELPELRIHPPSPGRSSHQSESSPCTEARRRSRGCSPLPCIFGRAG